LKHENGAGSAASAGSDPGGVAPSGRCLVPDADMQDFPRASLSLTRLPAGNNHHLQTYSREAADRLSDL
jgi:hypothetical protein